MYVVIRESVRSEEEYRRLFASLGKAKREIELDCVKKQKVKLF
jgi:hypothetical protein